MEIKAIRSLQCPDHAHNIPPSVLSITWLLGKRCNYDCSYCSPHLHDAVSPFASAENCISFASHVDEWAIQHNKRLKWNFSGGEPFLDPAFYQLIPKIFSHGSCEQINVTTNGSLPISRYRDLLPYLAGLTVSVHLERSTAEVDRVVQNILLLHQHSDKTLISVNLMFLPGRSQQVQNIVDILQQHDVSFVLRRISPPVQTQDLLPYQPARSKKQVELLDITHQADHKYQWKILNDQTQMLNRQNYYSPDELDLLGSHDRSASWNNLGAWFADGSYQELNADNLIANAANRFTGWTCFAGVDQIEIDFDGTIYRGVCQEGGAIGHINDKISFIEAPVICQRQWCSCTTDVAVRKSRPQFLHLVNKTDL